MSLIIEDPTGDGMYERLYWEIQKALDKILGTEVDDGAGQGIVAEIWLLAQQRDEARAALARMAAPSATLPAESPAPRVWESPERLAVLTVHQLNMLWADSCCSTCCAPCGVVREMADEGSLDSVILAGPAHLYEGSSWWVDGAVDRTWLYSRWDCQAKPRCDPADLEARFVTEVPSRPEEGE